MGKKNAAATESLKDGAVDSSGDAKKKAPMRKEAKAGILFPVGKINKRMAKSGWTDRVGGTAPIWVAAVCDYLAREVVDATAKACKDGGKHKRIQPRDVILAIRNDPDLNRVFAGVKVLVGDKLKGVSDEIVCEADKRYKDATKKKNEVEA